MIGENICSSFEDVVTSIEKRNEVAILHLLNTPNINPEYNNNELLLLSVQNKLSSVALRLLEFPEVIEKLKQQIAKYEQYCVLSFSAKNKLFDVLKFILLELDKDRILADKENKILCNLLDYGFFDALDCFLEYPSVQQNIAARGNLALRLATRAGNLKAVDKLLEYPEVQKEVTASNAFDLAAGKGYEEIVSRLTEIPGVVKAFVNDPKVLEKIRECNGPVFTPTRLMLESILSRAKADPNWVTSYENSLKLGNSTKRAKPILNSLKRKRADSGSEKGQQALQQDSPPKKVARKGV